MDVIQKQCLLKYLKFYVGTVDGIWGQQSQQAAEAFQRVHNLEVDGIIGPVTEGQLIDAVKNGEFAPEPEKETVPGDATTTNNSGGPEWWANIKYFSRREFRCPCPRCGGFPVEPSEKLVRIADRIRAHFGNPITISSGVRCQAHNDELKGSVKNSRHVQGKAMDFCVRGFSAATVLDYAQSLVHSGELRYAYAIDGSYVHIDVA